MKYRRLDAYGDYSFGQNKYNFVEGVEAVAQSIKTRLLLLYNEWWENLEEGTQLFQKILGQRMTEESKKAFDAIIKERILTTQYVIKLIDFSSEFNYKEMKYIISTSVETEFGTISDLVVDVGV